MVKLYLVRKWELQRINRAEMFLEEGRGAAVMRREKKSERGGDVGEKMLRERRNNRNEKAKYQPLENPEGMKRWEGVRMR